MQEDGARHTPCPVLLADAGQAGEILPFWTRPDRRETERTVGLADSYHGFFEFRDGIESHHRGAGRHSGASPVRQARCPRGAGLDAGASLGNLICPNNTVAACATVDQIGNENKVMKRTLPAFAVILVLYMALTMLYTCVLFPSFGV